MTREEAIKTLKGEAWICCAEKYNEALNMAIKALDTVDAVEEIKIGHWIYDYTSADGHRTYHCSECGCYLQPKHSEPLRSFKWCSLCGAKMIEPQESEKINCKSTKCENCINHNYCDYEPQESEEA